MNLKRLVQFTLCALLGVSRWGGAAEPIGPPESRATYRREVGAARLGTEIESFTLGFGPLDAAKTANQQQQWIELNAVKVDGTRFTVSMMSNGWPGRSAEENAPRITRYLLREGDGPAREYVNRRTGRPVLPSIGAWEYLWPHPPEDGLKGEGMPLTVNWLGHRYVLEQQEDGVAFVEPADVTRMELTPDALIGVPSNKRTKDSVRRYNGSDYEMVPLAREDYTEMIAAGMNCFNANAAQAKWLEDEPVFTWGIGGADVLFPECLFRSTYLGPTIHIDEPAVGTRDYVMRPKLAKDPELRAALTPTMMLDAFKEHYKEAIVNGSPTAFMKGLRGRADVDAGTMDLTQRNLYAWETMIASAAWQLSAEPENGPRAIVFEPPGHIGTRRTLPEMNMAYGCQLRTDNPANLEDMLIGFLRGGARATGKDWGISIYGSVDRDDAPWWLTHAYDLGGKYFFFWDNYQSACVPYGECLALARHLSGHIKNHPDRNAEKLRRAGEVAILLPPGYDLGHVRMGRGVMWGLDELNLERVNSKGVRLRSVMGTFFTEVERCLRGGVAFDLMWDLDGLNTDGYREVVRVLEDGRVEVTAEGGEALLDGPRVPERPAGSPPELAVEISRGEGPNRDYTARARVIEGSAPVYYTTGADRGGVYKDAKVLWELYGPKEEDYAWLQYAGSPTNVTREGEADIVEIKFAVERPGQYRLRAAASDLAGRSAVSWTDLEVGE